MLDLIAIIASTLLLASCTGSAKPGREAWQRARTIAEAHLRKAYGEPPAWRIVEEREGTPFLFEVRSPEEGAVLVHGDQVFTQKGLGGLDRYLRESRCVELRTANINDMIVLLHLLQTFPPFEGGEDYITRISTQEGLRPRLDFHDGGKGTLHLFYILESVHPGDEEGEDQDDDEEAGVLEWTLTMDPGQAPFWTRAVRHWDRTRKVFTDADHKN